MKLKNKFGDEELQKIFNDADRDKNGKIGVDTLRKSLTKLGCNVDDDDFERFLQHSGKFGDEFKMVFIENKLDL